MILSRGPQWRGIHPQRPSAAQRISPVRPSAMGEDSFVQLPTHRWMPASGLMRRGSHAPSTDRQVQINSGSVPMHAHVHDSSGPQAVRNSGSVPMHAHAHDTTDPPTVRRFDDAKNSVFDPDSAPYETFWTS